MDVGGSWTPASKRRKQEQDGVDSQGLNARRPQAAGKLGPGDKPAAPVTWEAEARGMTSPV